MEDFPTAPQASQSLEDMVRRYLRAVELVKAAEDAKEALRREFIALANGQPEVDAGNYRLKISLRKRRNVDWSAVRVLACIPDTLVEQHTIVSEYYQVDVKAKP